MRRYGKQGGRLLALALAAMAGSPGCQITAVSPGGPAPLIETVARAQTGFPAEAVLCTALGGTLVLTGRFSPRPSGVLTDAQGLDLPAVVAVGADGAEHPLGGVTYDQLAGTLGLTVGASELAVDTYALRVTNPNGKSTTSPGALVIVPPPTLAALSPASGINSQPTPVQVQGTAMRAAADGTEPSVTMALAAGGIAAALGGVAVASSTLVNASVPAALTPGFYDITLRNPEGCSATLAHGFEVRLPPGVDLVSVDPGFGWVSTRTSIQIVASNTNARGLQAIPEAFLVINGQDIPLVREAFLSAGTSVTTSIMSAVVPSAAMDARIVVGGPYAIKVANPDGATGVIENAFSVLADSPPSINAVSPARGDANASATFTVSGTNFKTGVVAGTGTPILSVALVAKDAATGQLSEFPCTTVNAVSSGSASCTMTLPAAGVYVVRVRHEDDHSFAYFASYSVTSAGRKLSSSTVAQATLGTKRRAHGITVGEDDLRNRFIYVAGGESSSGALASVEFANVSNFGDLSSWHANRVSLPEARTGLALVAVGRYLYALGGSSDGVVPLVDDATHKVALRAVILGSDTAPTITNTSSDALGSLAAGAYYYRVAAVMKASTSNPLGETLPSDAETVRVQANGRVTLSFASPQPSSVDHFIVYRSPSPNMAGNTELVLDSAVASAATSYVDAGVVTPTGLAPLPAGSTGTWVAVGAGVGQMRARYDHAAVALQFDASSAYIYVTGGRQGAAAGAPDVLDTVDVAYLSGDGGSVSQWVAGPLLPEPRAEHTLVLSGTAEVTTLAAHAILAVGGTASVRGSFTAGHPPQEALRAGRIDSTAGATQGDLIDWPLAGTERVRVGLTAAVVNDFCYVFNGLNGTPESQQSPASIAAGTPPSPAFSSFTSGTTSFNTPNVNSYRSGLVLAAGYFYFVAGSVSADVTTTSDVVLRGGY